MRAFAAVFLATSLCSLRLSAQLESVAPGARIRVRLLEPKGQRMRGELVSRIHESIEMQGYIDGRFRNSRTLPRSVAVSNVARFDVSTGTSPVRGLLEGAGYGVAASAAYGSLVWFIGTLGSTGTGPYVRRGKVSGWGSARNAAIALVPICAVIRGFNPPDTWSRVYPAR